MTNSQNTDKQGTKLENSSASVQKRVRDQIAHNLVQEFSRGNVSLQLGLYMTQEDVDALKKEVLEHDFSKP